MAPTPTQAKKPKQSITKSLLSRAHSPTSTARIYADKIQHKPVLLTPTTHDARASRRTLRASKQLPSNTTRPRPLSAREKRTLHTHDLPRGEAKYALYAGLHRLWCAYMRDILGSTYITRDAAGPKLVSADYHGAELLVVRSACVGRVGLRGIVLRDTKFTFVLVTRKDVVKVVPKEGTVFRFEVPLVEAAEDASAEAAGEVRIAAEPRQDPFVFEIHGAQFMTRAPDRANKKFKMHIAPGL